MSETRVYDDRPCILGEGPLWHPLRNQLFWFDILNNKLMRDDGVEWAFDHHVSAAGWLDQDNLLIASETALFTFNLETGASHEITKLEADNPVTRSNDGRADPWGGFWIGTMGKKSEPNAGAIYRYYKGELRQLFAPITISNAICFSPDGAYACFTDTIKAQIMRVRLDAKDGWPNAEPQVFLDLKSEKLNPDGAIIATDGSFLNAQWGASRVARYDMQGQFMQAFDFPTAHISCPALGGPEMTTLFATSAQMWLSEADIQAQPKSGMTFALEAEIKGQPEHQVIL